MQISTVSVLSACALVACTLHACASPSRARTASSTTAADDVVSAPLAPRAAADASAPEGPPPAPERAPRCRVTVTDTQGCGPSDVETLIEPVRPRMEHCRGATGGTLRIRVHRAAGGKLAFDVEPGSSLDPVERKCVLDALSTLNIDESSTAWSGLNVRPTGFTSLLTIEW